MQAMLGEKGREIPDAFPRRTTEAMTMTTLAWICAGLIAGSPAADTSPPASRTAAAYQEARAKAGRSPEEQVRLALWCEAHGLTNERLHHLALAVLADPGNVAARGLMGLVARDGRWSSPESVASKAQADPTLAEYEARRLKAPYTADGQWALGIWADEHDLRDQARAHLTAVIRLDPSRDAAWKKLGYRRFEGRWRTDAQLAASKAESEARDRAEKHWPPLLAKWRGWLDSPEKRAEAEAGLDSVDDPRAVSSVLKVFGRGTPAAQGLAVRLLGRIDTPGSSRGLAMLATWGGTPEIRRAAAEVLRHRDPREFLGPLVGGFRQVVRYEFGPVMGADGHSHLSLFVEGKQHNVQVTSNWVYNTPAQSTAPRLFAEGMPFDPYGVQASQGPDFGYGYNAPAAMTGFGYGMGALAGGKLDPASALVRQATYAAIERDAQIAQAQARKPAIGPNFAAQTSAMMAQIDDYNATVPRDNAAIYASLGLITGQALPMDPEAWKGWWVDSLGYSYKSSSQAKPTVSRPTYEYTIVSCFAAGTPVRTLTGDRPIEAIRVGDQVLSQDTATGGLRYRTITAIHHNPPATALRVKLGGEVILATGFHRFWKVGQGWVMARELKAGDVLRTLVGPAKVESIESDKVQPVYNLDVADDADFFVGKLGALVHDNTLPDPRRAPFDALARQAD